MRIGIPKVGKEAKDMMINKRLIGTVSESKKYIAGNVAFQWVSLVANIVLMGSIATLLAKLFCIMRILCFWTSRPAIWTA